MFDVYRHSPFLADKLSISDLDFQKKTIRKTKNILMFRLTNFMCTKYTLLFKTFWSLDNVFFSSHQVYYDGGKKRKLFFPDN